MVTKFSAKVTINDLGLLSLTVSQEDFDKIMENHREKAMAGRIVLTEILVDKSTSEEAIEHGKTD